MPARFPITIDASLVTAGEWQTAMSSDSEDPVFSFSLHIPPIVRDEVLSDGTKVLSRGKRKPQIQADAFAVRNKVLKIDKPGDALDLFQQFGPWRLNELYGNDAPPVTFSEIVKQRDTIHDFLLMPPIEQTSFDLTIPRDRELWNLTQDLELIIPFTPAGLGFVTCKDIEHALRASVFLDKRDALPWRPCARPDCLLPFKVEQPRMRYHSPECARIQASRAWNERKRKSDCEPPDAPAAGVQESQLSL